MEQFTKHLQNLTPSRSFWMTSSIPWQVIRNHWKWDRFGRNMSNFVVNTVAVCLLMTWHCDCEVLRYQQTHWWPTLDPTGMCIWVRSQRCSWLVTWFCYQLIAKPGNKIVAPSRPDPYIYEYSLGINSLWLSDALWHRRTLSWPINSWKCMGAYSALWLLMPWC